MEHPHRGLTKEGPAPLRMAVFLAANAARRTDPQLASTYYHLMCDRGAHHNKATCAIARKLAERIWTVIHRGRPYQYRNLNGEPITIDQARQIVRSQFQITDDIRTKHRRHTLRKRRARLAA